MDDFGSGIVEPQRSSSFRRWAVVKLNSNGQMVVHERCGQFHDQGYDLAINAVRARAGKQPGTLPIVPVIGGMLAVLDAKTMSCAHTVAE